MQARDRQRWLEICARAAMEDDPDRLGELAQEITRMLEDEELRLRSNSLIRLAG
jgi:hypothetical protein